MDAILKKSRELRDSESVFSATLFGFKDSRVLEIMSLDNSIISKTSQCGMVEFSQVFGAEANRSNSTGPKEARLAGDDCGRRLSRRDRDGLFV